MREDPLDARVGDEITFRAVCRWGAPKLRRKVVELGTGGLDGHVGVNAHGCRPFWVRPHEIIEVHHAAP